MFTELIATLKLHQNSFCKILYHCARLNITRLSKRGKKPLAGNKELLTFSKSSSLNGNQDKN